MAGSGGIALSSTEKKEAGENYRRRLVLCSILFVLFFLFYMVAAVVQTPAFKNIAEIPFLGMPLGLFLSLMVFPVSWAIIVIFFIRWR